MKTYPNQEEVDQVAVKLITLRKIANKNKTVKQEFLKQQQAFIEKFKYLVLTRVAKYKKFSNYADLEQDGFEALMLALKTYNVKKGSFTWWADKYISTRVSRSANRHSTIKVPLKKAKEIKPFKTIAMPVIVDKQPDPHKVMENVETSKLVLGAIKKLPMAHQTILNLIYGFHGMKQHSILDSIQIMKISKSQGQRLLEDAKQKLKTELTKTLI